MAVVRARSAPPYALISFITLWVVSTVLAILFYLQWTKADQRLADRERVISKTVAPKDSVTMGPNILTDFAGPNSKDMSYLQAAFNEISALKGFITGNTNTPFAQVQAQVGDASTLGGPAQPLVAKVRALANDKAALTAQYTKTQSDLQGLNTTVAAQSKTDSDTIHARQLDIETLTKEKATLEEQLAAMRAAMNDASAKNQSDITAAQDKSDQVHRQDVLVAEGLNSSINRLELQIKELRTRLVNLMGTNNPTVGEADGKVMTVNPAAKEVYINLHGQGVVPGLTFTVYDPRTGVRFGTDEESLGKGSIEVITPGEFNTLCSITRVTKGQSISEGDLISNLVFNANKNRKFHFVIYGDFDLDGDGIATADERERLTSLVTNWGGVIDTDVNSQTDYLIVGEKPKSPALTIGDAAPTTGTAASQRASEQDTYDALIVEAKRLSIPVLNANRFLNMIGYYSTTIVRH